MLYIQFNSAGAACHAQSEYPGNEEMSMRTSSGGRRWGCRGDRWSFEKARDIAQQLNEAVNGSADVVSYLAVDAGEGTYPRYDVIRMPQVGDEVSYGFNGDYYPCGKIARISRSLSVITTDTGESFYRRRLTGTWLRHKTWALVHGHISERNPSF